MKKLPLLSAIVFATVYLFGQCPPPGFPLPGNTCPEAPVLCQNLDGYCNTINNNNIIQNFPGCPAEVLNNDEWIAFYAGTTAISFEITPSNCQGIYGQFGLQGALYDGCNGNVLATQCECTEDAFTLTYDQFIPGEIYWLVLDGCAGDICDYETDLLQVKNLEK